MKKLLSLLIVVALAVSCMASVAFATEAPVVTVTDVTADDAAENELTLAYSVEGNPGFLNYKIVIDYDDEIMTLTDITAGEVGVGGFFYGNTGENVEVPEMIGTVGYTNATMITDDGVLFTATFTVNPDAEDYTVGATVEEFVGENDENLEVVVEPYVSDTETACDHSGDFTWDSNADEHWKVCDECGEEIPGSRERHDYVNGVCECGALEPETDCDHDGDFTWDFDDDEHWKVCDDCGKEIPGSREPHDYVNGTCECGAEEPEEDDGFTPISPTGPSQEDDAQAPRHPFTDVLDTDWFAADVQYVWENGLMNGMTATTFGPYQNITRGQIVTILYRLEGEPAVAAACPFADVAPGSYYEAAITWAAANGVVTGYDAVTFGPDDPITREQMAAILYRYAQYKGLASPSLAQNLAVFTDAASVSEYAVEAMNWAVGQHLINGMGDGTVAPQGNAIRAQAAAILHRFCETLQLIETPAA